MFGIHEVPITSMFDARRHLRPDCRFLVANVHPKLPSDSPFPNTHLTFYVAILKKQWFRRSSKARMLPSSIYSNYPCSAGAANCPVQLMSSGATEDRGRIHTTKEVSYLITTSPLGVYIESLTLFNSNSAYCLRANHIVSQNESAVCPTFLINHL